MPRWSCVRAPCVILMADAPSRHLPVHNVIVLSCIQVTGKSEIRLLISKANAENSKLEETKAGLHTVLGHLKEKERECAVARRRCKDLTNTLIASDGTDEADTLRKLHAVSTPLRTRLPPQIALYAHFAPCTPRIRHCICCAGAYYTSTRFLRIARDAR